MRAEQILKGGTEPCTLASPLAVLMTERILAEWEIAQCVMFPEERVDLCRIIQATLDEQKNLLSQATGRKNDEMTDWWRGMAACWGLALTIGSIIGLVAWALEH